MINYLQNSIGIRSLVLAGCLCPSVVLHAQADPSSARAVVTAFYRWYVPLAVKEGGESPVSLALARKPALFEPGLRKALMDDSAAQDAAPGEIVGIDFDPFLGGQDPEGRYIAGEVKGNGSPCLVPVYAVRNGKRMAKPVLTVELELRDEHWVFANFHYDNNTNLRAVLKTLSDSRK